VGLEGVGLGVGGTVAVGEGVMGGVGVGVVAGGVGVGVVAGRTVVDSMSKLLPVAGSKKVEVEAVAESLMDPTTVGVTTSFTVAMAKAAMLPRLQVMLVVPLQLP
jgi:hypothetical protein